MLKKLLKPEGELILETGNTASLSAKDHPRPFDLPDHLSFASESIIKEIFERLDFNILRIKKYPFLLTDLNSITRVLVKGMLPQYKTRIWYYFKGRKYSQIDMFIRARIKS